MTVCLGIDQSYSGLAMVAYNASTGEHRDQLKSYPAERFRNQTDRLNTIRHDVSRNIMMFTRALGSIDVVALEGYAPGSKYGRELAGELAATIKLALYDNLLLPQCWPIVIAPTKLKKYTTGRGTAAKNEMLLGVYKKWGVDYSDDNLADAYSLARAAHTWFEKAGTNSELETLKGLKRYSADTHSP
ncbi:hypothetical protein ACFWAP_00360 [Streptomyces goshikiensis]|uniref:hypothetical protein n=1 Tax=Streptomyces goshikiensis TaxID=1942 RepID=UPI00364E64D1